MTEAQKNAADLSAIKAAEISYTVRKYAGAWVPVVIKNGKRRAFNHCPTAYVAMGVAIEQAAKIARS